MVRRQIGRQRRSIGRDLGLHDPLEVLEYLPEGRLEPRLPEPEPDEASRLLALLTPREGEVMLLRMQAMKYREIAAHLGISPNSVSTLLSRALRKLQKAVSDKSVGASAANAVEKAISETL